ncbi:hypothetical protein A2U01_0020572, partial [Trifolium medium]|nr:hypothetical protein [Trifolium medium]
TSALTAAERDDAEADPKLVEHWKHANKVAKEILDNVNNKYTAEDATKQKFVVGNYLRWQMTEDKEIKAQINEYHKLLQELKTEKINLSNEFVASVLAEKLPSS